MSKKGKGDIRIALGSTWIDRHRWDLAKAQGFTRKQLVMMIVENGLETLASHFDDLEICPHGYQPAWDCTKCEPRD